MIGNRTARAALACGLALAVSCASRGTTSAPTATDAAARSRPRPTEHRLDRDAEERNAAERRAWMEHMHRAAPGVDWRAIERENRRIEQERRNQLGRERLRAAGPANWNEVGSSNLAGRMHAAVIGPDGQTLYAGSSLGGVWRGGLDGSGWQPLSDNLWGGSHEVLVLPGEGPGDPDVVVVATDDGSVHVSRDTGQVWEVPVGTTGLSSIRGVGLLENASKTILLYARGPATNQRPSVLASTDYGRTFSIRWQGTTWWSGWMWVPRVGAGAVNRVYVVDAGQLRASTDGGFTFPTATTIATGTDAAVLAGSEAGAPTLYAALRSGNQWKLYASATGGSSWSYKSDLNDFWEALCASTINRNRLVYGGVEAHRSNDAGSSFTKINGWGDYYGDPEHKLHADIMGIHCWPDPSTPGQEKWYISTDGGVYVSHDGTNTVLNLSLEGLAVSQYYSTLSSRGDWDRIAAGSQDQGYQTGIVQHDPGPSTPLVQEISGDYGHLTSGDGTHDLVFSTYPGFTLVQDGAVDPALYLIDFPNGSAHAWLPPVVADPLAPESYYFCGERLYRYDRVSQNSWAPSIHSAQVFGGPGVAGDYISALAFAPTDPDRVYAVNDAGVLFYSTDHGVTWTQSAGAAPPQHYFYGNAITVHPDDPLEVAVGGSGYSNPGVIRSTDGGATWFAESTGLPQTMVYALVYARDGSGDLYAGTETGAWHWDRQTGLWENIMANTAPATIYWSAEVVNDGGTVRFGTYGRGIWDFARIAGDRDGDGHADASDACPNNLDPLQLDADGDSRGDACDNCRLEPNLDQANADDDGAGDLCDCAAFDPGVFSIPPEVTGLRWTLPETLTWDSVIPSSGDQTEHVIFRGNLGEFPVGVSTQCTATVQSAAQIVDGDLPAAGAGFWYLVRGENTCGEGSLGTWGAGTPRSTPTCN